MKKKQKKITVPQANSRTEEEYREMPPKVIYAHIDTEFRKMNSYLMLTGRQADLRETLVRWGVWSRKMNVIIRKRMKTLEGKDLAQLKLAYAYWWNRTHFLETYRKGKLQAIINKKNFEAGKKSIKQLMSLDMTGEELQKKYANFYELVNRLSGEKELSREETDRALDGDPTVRENKF